MTTDDRGALSVESLLKLVLALVAILLVLQIVGIVVSWVARLFTPILLLIVGIVIILWYFDKL